MSIGSGRPAERHFISLSTSSSLLMGREKASNEIKNSRLRLWLIQTLNPKVSTKSKDTLTNDTTTVVTTTITTTEDGIYEPKVIHGMRKNGLNETELLVEWKGFVKPADWTWEERKEFEKSCPDIVGKWEKKEKGKGKAVQDRDFHEDGIYEVERIVKRMKVKGKCGYLVKWKDWNEGCNSWQEARLLRYDVPYLVEDFEKELELERKRKMGMEEEGEEEAGVIAKEDCGGQNGGGCGGRGCRGRGCRGRGCRGKEDGIEEEGSCGGE
ncbi:hypothetical protein EYC84_010522 [Monilinia fructicola]|uniref:Chromo domain-containing protein n=1 Tax=Monilinia fructicola TaxID=38448 RepID=A0A5M9J8P0_MONFR|nr:hypothetical protein EYC84_010522 [Monilinia fructicola]